MFTSLYLTKVFPASTPWADLKMIVMVGPSLMIRWMAIPSATTAANSGTIQTMEMRLCLLGTRVAWGKLLLSVGSAMRVYLVGVGIPDEPLVKRFSGDHRQHNYCCKEKNPGTRLHGHQRRKLNQGNRKGVDEHIEHRPSADKFDDPIEPRSLTIAAG